MNVSKLMKLAAENKKNHKSIMFLLLQEIQDKDTKIKSIEDKLSEIKVNTDKAVNFLAKEISTLKETITTLQQKQNADRVWNDGGQENVTLDIPNPETKQPIKMNKMTGKAVKS